MSGLSVTILGCSGTYAGPGGACSGYLVRSGTTKVWLDAGPGTLGRLQEHVTLEELDAIVLSHEHPDHWLELPVVRNALRYIIKREEMPVFGTRGTHVLATVLMGEFLPTLRWTDVTATSELTIGDMRWTFALTDHPVETYSCRVDANGRSIVYSADTGSKWTPSALGADIDMALIEASLDEEDAGTFQHLSAGEAGSLAREAGVSRLVLTHLQPGVDPDQRARAASDAFGRPVEVASIGTRYDV